MALQGPEWCLERGPGSPTAVVGIWALLQHHLATFFFIVLILDYSNPGQAEEGGEGETGTAVVWPSSTNAV